MNLPGIRSIRLMRKNTIESAGTRRAPASGLTRSMLMTGVVVASLGMGHASLAAADDFGRLFFTPAQRTQLENARARNLTLPPGQRHSGSADEATAPLRFDGMLIRSDGKTQHWANGERQPDGALVSGLKPGQVRANGRVYEPYQVLRPASPTPAEPAEKGAVP